jgi:hypothetical protein
MKNKLPVKYKKIAFLVSAMFGLATLSFNCAPSLFQGADYNYLNRSSSGGGVVDPFSGPKTSPWALQNTGQVLESMANLTGQSMAISAAQRAEYDARTGALSQSDKLTDINAPLQLAATSLGGEFCNGLITKESAAGATRKFFNGVNFAAALSGNSQQVYQSSISAMASGFWGRSLTAEESQILNAYYQDFVASAGTQVAQTKNLYLGTCSAMLASFDAITF